MGPESSCQNGAMTTQQPSGGSTLTDLEAIPGNDGKRYELVDGHIIVSPWPAHYGGVSFRLGPILSHAIDQLHGGDHR